MAIPSQRTAEQKRSDAQHKSSERSSAAHETSSAAPQAGTQGVQAAVMNPRQAAPEQLLEIQRLYGNQAVQRLLSTGAPVAPQSPPNPVSQTLSRQGLSGSLQGVALDSRSQSQIDSARGGGLPLDAGAGAANSKYGTARSNKVQTKLTAGAVQRKLAGDLEKVTLEGFKGQLSAKGIKLNHGPASKLFNDVKAHDKPFNTIDEVIAGFNLSNGGPPPINAIAKASEEAQKEALGEAAQKEKGAEKGAVSKPRFAVARKEAKKHKTVEGGGKHLIINFVWLGNNKFGPLEKFNLYSWRALGHTVNIYSYPFAGVAAHTLASLGLDEGDAQLVQLRETLRMDDQTAQANGDSTRATLTDARSILKKWLGAIPEQGKPTTEHIFNMVDLTKSYIGGTQRGIVLDAKVGPSVHLQDFADSFSDKLISYTRGGNTAEVPENQSMGTMQAEDTLRNAYAKRFNDKVKALANADHNAAWFNQITGYHGQSYQQTKQWLDVATKTPLGAEAGRELEVGEIGPMSHGPFRIFKRASDQTNKAGLKTQPIEVKNLADEVHKKELANSGGNQEFIAKALAAQGAMPDAV